MKNNKKIVEEQGVADAHPYGARPFKRINYVKKFLILSPEIYWPGNIFVFDPDIVIFLLFLFADKTLTDVSGKKVCLGPLTEFLSFKFKT